MCVWVNQYYAQQDEKKKKERMNALYERCSERDPTMGVDFERKQEIRNNIERKKKTRGYRRPAAGLLPLRLGIAHC